VQLPKSRTKKKKKNRGGAIFSIYSDLMRAKKSPIFLFFSFRISSTATRSTWSTMRAKQEKKTTNAAILGLFDLT
jgi:hypothetical protein